MSKQAKDVFFLQIPKAFDLDCIDVKGIGNKELAFAFDVYRSSMLETIHAVQLPFKTAIRAVLNERFQHHLVVSRLETMADFVEVGLVEVGDEKTDPAIEKQSVAKAKERLDSEMTTFIMPAIEERLLSLDEDEAIRISNKALLRQSAVMVWGCTESLLREFFRISLNLNPKLANEVIDDPESGKYWKKTGITPDLLEAYSYNVSAHMGDVLLEINSMISLGAICAGYKTVAKLSPAVSTAIRSKPFYRLYKLRNLIAHRSGVVDKEYIVSTGENVELGKKFDVSPEFFGEMFLASRTVAVELYKHVVSNTGPQSGNTG